MSLSISVNFYEQQKKKNVFNRTKMYEFYKPETDYFRANRNRVRKAEYSSRRTNDGPPSWAKSCTSKINNIVNCSQTIILGGVRLKGFDKIGLKIVLSRLC